MEDNQHSLQPNLLSPPCRHWWEQSVQHQTPRHCFLKLLTLAPETGLAGPVRRNRLHLGTDFLGRIPPRHPIQHPKSDRRNQHQNSNQVSWPNETTRVRHRQILTQPRSNRMAHRHCTMGMRGSVRSARNSLFRDRWCCVWLADTCSTRHACRISFTHRPLLCTQGVRHGCTSVQIAGDHVS